MWLVDFCLNKHQKKQNQLNDNIFTIWIEYSPGRQVMTDILLERYEIYNLHKQEVQFYI